jgi:hypothetical protein
MPFWTALRYAETHWSGTQAIFSQPVVMGHDGFQCEIRMNRVCTKTRQQTVMMDLTSLAGFDDDANPSSQLLFD